MLILGGGGGISVRIGGGGGTAIIGCLGFSSKPSFPGARGLGPIRSLSSE